MSDATPRDQLAQIIERELRNMWDDTTEYAKDVADDIQAAGWRPQARTVTEVTELDELPVRAVVVDESGLVLVCLGHRYANVVGNVWASEHGEWHLSRNLRLPVVVLREQEGE